MKKRTKITAATTGTAALTAQLAIGKLGVAFKGTAISCPAALPAALAAFAVTKGVFAVKDYLDAPLELSPEEREGLSNLISGFLTAMLRAHVEVQRAKDPQYSIHKDLRFKYLAKDMCGRRW